MPQLIDFSPLSRIGDTFLRAVEAQRDREYGDSLVRALGLEGGGGTVTVQPAEQAANMQPAAAGSRNVPSFAGGGQRMAMPPAAFAPLIKQAAAEHGLDEGMFTRQLAKESAFDPDVVSGRRLSSAGAAGVAQFMPATAQRFGIDPLNPAQAIPAAARYVAENRKLLGNDGLALAGYNWGEGNVQKWLARGGNPSEVPGETRDYVMKITGRPIEAWARAGRQEQATPQAAAPQAQEQLQPPDSNIRGIQDPTMRALLAQQLRRGGAERLAAVKTILEMRQKQAGQPFQFQGGWYQSDGNGEIRKVVDPVDRFRDETDDQGNQWGRNERTNERKFLRAGQDKFTEVKDEVGNLYKVNLATGERSLLRGVPTKVEELFHAGVKGDSPRGQQVLAKQEGRIGAAEQKMIVEAEDESIELKEGLRSLMRARELNPRIMTGMGAGLRATIGGKLPDAAVPDLGGVFEPNAAKATLEWQQMTRPEAIALMSKQLKGATTEKEMAEFLRMYSDPSIPAEIRDRVLDSMIRKVEGKLQLNAARAQDIRGGTYFKPGNGPGTKLPAGASADQAVAEARRAWQTANPLQRAQIQERLNAWGIKVDLGGE